MKAQINRYKQFMKGDLQNEAESRRENLIYKYAPLVKYITDRLAMRIPRHISKDELISAGILGLIDAVDKYDESLGIKFSTYAEYRIKGAIIDELRKMDWLTRTDRKNIRKIENAISNLKIKLSRDPDEEEIAKELDIDIEEYFTILGRFQGVKLFSLEEIIGDGETTVLSMQASEEPTPFDKLKIKEIKEIISKAINELKKQEQIVLSLYYYEELTLKEIAHIMNLTESRISQIHSQAILKLRVKLNKILNDEKEE